MSSVDIFAAQFWTWPDPAVKRDNTGRILFVNAAFLQLFGGQAQDWHGNAVGGWSAPQAAGQPHRFETRIPPQGTLGEQVYDWIEMTMQDGTAFALARNVTPFITVPTPPPGAHMPAPPQTQTPPAVNAAAEVAMQAAQVETVLNAAYEQAPAEATEPAAAQAEIAAAEVFAPPPAANLAETVMPDPVTADPALSTPQPQSLELPEVPQNVEVQEAEISPVQTQAPSPAAPAETDTTDERDYERRALPIETDSAVLGNNWRDAVIAKAVGIDTPEEQDEAESAEVNSAPPAAESEGGAVRILLAEDNAINALLTRTLLEAEGHTVETVEDGALAVEAMKTSSYDLIFMDMRMPNMDGLEATRKIRALPNVTSELPIIALTANAFDDDRNACFDSGMNDFMTKPVSAEELSDMVKNWTSGGRQALAS